MRAGRDAVLVDDNSEAIEVMARRLAFAEPRFHGCEPPLDVPAGGRLDPVEETENTNSEPD